MIKRKLNWSLDRVVTICAISISLFTLIVFMRQTNIIEKQSRLSALPYLYLETGFNPNENVITVTLNNYGVGPAIIENMLIFHNGDTYSDGFDSFIREDIFMNDSLNIVSSSGLSRGLAMPAGSERVLIKVGGTEKQFTKAAEFIDKLDQSSFDYLISYKSIYDDKWKIHYSNPSPQQY